MEVLVDQPLWIGSVLVLYYNLNRLVENIYCNWYVYVHAVLRHTTLNITTAPPVSMHNHVLNWKLSRKRHTGETRLPICLESHSPGAGALVGLVSVDALVRAPPVTVQTLIRVCRKYRHGIGWLKGQGHEYQCLH